MTVMGPCCCLGLWASLRLCWDTWHKGPPPLAPCHPCQNSLGFVPCLSPEESPTGLVTPSSKAVFFSKILWLALATYLPLLSGQAQGDGLGLVMSHAVWAAALPQGPSSALSRVVRNEAA